MHDRRGASIIGIMVTIACVAVIGSIVLVSVWYMRQAQARWAADARQIGQIHQSLTIFSSEFELDYPSPGLVKRLPIPAIDRSLPGFGGEDVRQNTTANFYSMLISQNYIRPETCIGPTEPSGHVLICEGYDWNMYKPDAGVYWDPAFTADLSRVSNTSYAHLPVFPGAARIRQWGATGDAMFPVLGNRGPRGGADDASSVTYAIHDPREAWGGHMCYRDGHVDFIETFTPHGADNIFAYDEGVTGGDAIITFTKTMNPDGPTLQHD